MDKSLSQPGTAEIFSKSACLMYVCIQAGPWNWKMDKKTVSSSCAGQPLDSVTMEELYAKVKNQERNRKVVLDLRREIPFLPVPPPGTGRKNPLL